MEQRSLSILKWNYKTKMNEASCNNVSYKISQKVSLLDEKIGELIAVRTLLLNGEKKCQDGCRPEQPEDNCEILVSNNFTA